MIIDIDYALEIKLTMLMILAILITVSLLSLVPGQSIRTKSWPISKNCGRKVYARFDVPILAI